MPYPAYSFPLSLTLMESDKISHHIQGLCWPPGSRLPVSWCCQHRPRQNPRAESSNGYLDFPKAHWEERPAYRSGSKLYHLSFKSRVEILHSARTLPTLQNGEIPPGSTACRQAITLAWWAWWARRERPEEGLSRVKVGHWKYRFR